MLREKEPREPREKNRRAPRRETESTAVPLVSGTGDGADTEPKPKPALSNSTANPGNPEESKEFGSNPDT